MANTQVYDAPAFSRITSKGRPTSWTLGIPITIVLVALIGAFAYFASKASSLSSQVEAANQQLAQQQQQFAGVQQKLTQNEADLGVARNPGFATIILQPGKDSKAWASAVLGEGSAKGFAQVRAYGLKPAAEGKAYQAWVQVGEDKPVLIGILDPAPDGSAFVQNKDLPSVAKGARIFVSLGEEKATAVSGATLMEAKFGAPAPAGQKKADDE